MMHELGIAAVFRGSMLEWARPGERVLMAGLCKETRAMEQTDMLTKLSLAAGLALAAATLAPVAASAAAPWSPIPAVVAAGDGQIQKAQWGWGYGRCHAWRRECAARWGWRTPGFFRCLARHGC
jgi:hypothetical protein